MNCPRTLRYNPHPATVTDWESERQFLVTSYNKTDRAYLYSVEYADVVSAGNVTLNTQREVTNFGQTGISVIDGNLAVGTRRSDDPVKTLDGLERLVAGRQQSNDRSRLCR